MSIVIRPATENDRPSIIEMLRLSLGESTVPKSESLWVWKHELNPFGVSNVLVAEQEGKLIGVRAFLHWHFQRRGRFYSALRAVDTATHPEHKGKGIFKKLTLQLVEICKSEGFHFIYNTPNQQSRPGYLKMGWEQQGKLPLKIKILHPAAFAMRLMTKKKRVYKEIPSQKWTQDVLRMAERVLVNETTMATILSPAYLSWRYANNPLYQYHYFTDHKNMLLIGRVKDGATGRELRLVDFLIVKGGGENRQIKNFLREDVRKFCAEHHVDLVTLSGQQFRTFRKYFGWMGSLPVMPVGPIVTIRDLNMKFDYKRLLNKKYWNFSLGDLELF